MPKPDGDKDGKDTAVVMRRAKPTAMRNPSGAMGLFSLMPPGRQHGDLAAAAAAAAEAAARTNALAKNLQERAAKRFGPTPAAQDAAGPTQSPGGAQQVPEQPQPGGTQQAAQPQQPSQAQQAAQKQESKADGEEAPLNRTASFEKAIDAATKPAFMTDVPAGGDAATATTAAGASQPAASVVASRPPAGTDGPREAAAAGVAAVPGLALPAASAAPTAPPGAAGTAAAAARKVDTSVAASKAGAALPKRGDRVTYRGKVNPAIAAAQERMEQLQQAISRVEASSSARAREYLPQLLVSLCCVLAAAAVVSYLGRAQWSGGRGHACSTLCNMQGSLLQLLKPPPIALLPQMRRTLLGQGRVTAPRIQSPRGPPVGSKGRVVRVSADKVCWLLWRGWCDGRRQWGGHCNVRSALRMGLHRLLPSTQRCAHALVPCRCKCSLTSPLRAAAASPASVRSAASSARPATCRSVAVWDGCAGHAKLQPAVSGACCAARQPVQHRLLSLDCPLHACPSLTCVSPRFTPPSVHVRWLRAGAPRLLERHLQSTPHCVSLPHSLIAGGGGQGRPAGVLAAGTV